MRHSLNALFPIDVSNEGDANVKPVRPVQFEKAFLPMVVAEAGISKEPILEQSSKAKFPIEFNDEGEAKFKPVMLLQPLKAYSSRVVTEEGIVILSSPVQLRNAYFPIPVIDVGNVKAFKLVFAIKVAGLKKEYCGMPFAG